MSGYSAHHEVTATLSARVFVTVKDGKVTLVNIVPDQTPFYERDIVEAKVYGGEADHFAAQIAEALDALNGAAWEPLLGLPENVHWEG